MAMFQNYAQGFVQVEIKLFGRSHVTLTNSKKNFEIILLENPSESNAKADISKQENAVGVPQIRNMRFKLKT